MRQGNDAIERDIEASRSRLDGTLGKLQRRLTPSGIVEDMLGNARRSDVGGGFYDGALDAVRRNPLPVLLICLGATLLLRTAAGRTGRTDRPSGTGLVPARKASRPDRAEAVAKSPR